MAPARGTALLVALAGVGPVLCGTALLLTAPSPRGSFGWFSYTPLQETRPARAVLVLGLQHCLGAGLIAVGVLVLAVVSGYHVGRRRASSGRAGAREG